MKRGSLIAANLLVVTALQLGSGNAAPQQVPAATFRSSVDVVRLTAVVRDGKGRFVKNLRASDFEVFDAGLRRPIAEFRQDIGGISVALLFDVSGSMEARVADAHEAAGHLLSWLDGSDEAAVFTFDTQLDEIAPFAVGLKALPTTLGSITPFGATSVNDAIARTAERMKDRQGRRRAVVVFTDGNDNASRLKPEEVSATASAIDVPVYIFGVVSTVDNPTSDAGRETAKQSPLAGPLMDLAAWTGGHVFVSSSPADRSAAARQVVDELRHQYLIAFESSGRPGWHPLEVRARGKDLVVRARSGYVAGQSRPVL